MSTKQIRLLENWRGYNRGKVISTTDVTADALVRQGKAIFTRPQEAMSTEVPEKAVKPRAMRRKAKTKAIDKIKEKE